MTALGSVPNAHTQGEPEGTWNLEKLHLELKYLGRKLAEAKLQRGEREQRDGLEQRAAWRTPRSRVNIYPERTVGRQETQLTGYTQKARNRGREEGENLTFRASQRCHI